MDRTFSHITQRNLLLAYNSHFHPNDSSSMMQALILILETSAFSTQKSHLGNDEYFTSSKPLALNYIP